MSMVINLVEDHNIYLCEGGPVYNGGVQPTPITYLTQWKMMGNSVVHTDEYLTQWKVSGNSQIQQYLTQWKVEGNSVVDNNAILSCGDLGQDGKYHVKISNGVDVFDIALDEPLRKVNDVADSIEFADGVTTVTRAFSKVNWTNLSIHKNTTSEGVIFFSLVLSGMSLKTNNILSDTYPTYLSATLTKDMGGYGVSSGGSASYKMIRIVNASMDSYTTDEFRAANSGVELIYELATPTTEVIQAPQISVSPTNTYSSANETPYSAFTYANPLIYSCGDYSDVDGKYHVKISNGVTIYDIPLTEPLRKVNDVADKIEFVNGVATLTRCLHSFLVGNQNWTRYVSGTSGYYRMATADFNSVSKHAPTYNVLTNVIGAIYPSKTGSDLMALKQGVVISQSGSIFIYDSEYNTDANTFKAARAGVEIIFELDTPTTEVIQVSPFPVSPTDTYTSDNDTPYSAFEYKKNVEIWSCGEYSAVDGKYHILVQPLGGSIADIALDEPLRKVNAVADSIEFPSSSEIVRFTSYFNIPLSNINHALRNYDFYNYMSSTNTSGQYIDTGLRIGGTDSVDFRVKFFLQNAGGWFGAFDGESYISPGFYATDLNGTSDIISLCCGNSKAYYDCSIKSEINSSLYLIKTYAFTKIPSFNGVNGEINKGELSNATYTPTHNAFIFARNNAGTPSSTRIMSVYSLIVHGKCVFVVAKRKSDNAIGLLNLLDSNPTTQLHTNQGSGNDFTLGSQITFEQLCSDIMNGYSDAPTITNNKALVTIRVEENGGELSPLDTPTIELVNAPQIQEADSYSCVISQGAKAVEWSSFETE